MVNKATQVKKYVKLKAGSSKEEYSEIGKKIKEGEIKWAYYALDNDIAYHYYVVLNK